MNVRDNAVGKDTCKEEFGKKTGLDYKNFVHTPNNVLFQTGENSKQIYAETVNIDD
jgi:hypothetical protein